MKNKIEIFQSSNGEIVFNSDIKTEIIRAMQNKKLENFENIKAELAQEIKKELQKTPKDWDRAKQKSLKRKEYIESLLNEK